MRLNEELRASADAEMAMVSHAFSIDVAINIDMDIVSMILFFLQLQDAQAASVCKSWAGAWRIRLKGMLRPCQVPPRVDSSLSLIPPCNHERIIKSVPGGLLIVDTGCQMLWHYDSNRDIMIKHTFPSVFNGTLTSAALVYDMTAWLVIQYNADGVQTDNPDGSISISEPGEFYLYRSSALEFDVVNFGSTLSDLPHPIYLNGDRACEQKLHQFSDAWVPVDQLGRELGPSVQIDRIRWQDLKLSSSFHELGIPLCVDTALTGNLLLVLGCEISGWEDGDTCRTEIVVLEAICGAVERRIEVSNTSLERMRATSGIKIHHIPCAMAVHNDFVYVVFHRHVQVLNYRNGEPHQRITNTHPTSLWAGAAVVRDRMYLSDRQRHCISMLTLNGEVLQTVKCEGSAGSICVDDCGRVWCLGRDKYIETFAGIL